MRDRSARTLSFTHTHPTNPRFRFGGRGGSYFWGFSFLFCPCFFFSACFSLSLSICCHHDTQLRRSCTYTLLLHYLFCFCRLSYTHCRCHVSCFAITVCGMSITLSIESVAYEGSVFVFTHAMRRFISTMLCSTSARGGPYVEGGSGRWTGEKKPGE